MASPVKDAKAKMQAKWPGATVVERHKGGALDELLYQQAFAVQTIDEEEEILLLLMA